MMMATTEELTEQECCNCGNKLTDAEAWNLPGCCTACYRDPETNNCESCGKHLSGIAYAYVCGDCLRQKDKQTKVVAVDASDVAPLEDVIAENAFHILWRT